MRIKFLSAKVQRIFNDYASLEALYGADLAAKVAVRMSVLVAARHLGLVPRHPPIRLRPVDSLRGQFTVDLTPPRKLRFGTGLATSQDDHKIEEIEIIAID